MRLMSPGAARRRPFDCSYWRAREPNVDPAGRDGVHDHYSVIVPAPAVETAGDALEAVARHVLSYRVFATHRMHHCICGAGPTLENGDTIVQRIFVGPLAIEAGVRVVDVFRDGDRIGFSYVTLEGHVERGVASFFVARSREREVTFHIESWSTPSALTTWLAPGVARYFQRKSVHEALHAFVLRVTGREPPPG